MCCAHDQQGPPPQIPPQSAQQLLAQPKPGAGEFKISGIVVDAGSGLPLAGAEVRATRLTTTPAGTSAARILAKVSGSDGRFTFAGLEAGRYQLTARKRGFPPTLFEQHENVWTAVIVGPGLDSENLVFQLRQGASISGQVTEESSEPIRRAQVMLFRQSLASGERAVQLAGQRQTDDQGRYRFSALQPGTYYVAVSAQPWYASFSGSRQIRSTFVMRDGPNGTVTTNAPPDSPPAPDPLDVAYPLTFYLGATDPGRASPLTLLPGEQATADFSLFPLPSVHLKVQLPAGREPNQYFNASAMQATMGSQQMPAPVRTMMESESVMDIITPPGHLHLNIVGYQNGREISRSQQEVDASRDAEITVAAPAAAASIGGTVKLPAGATLPRQCLVVIHHRETGQGHTAQITAEGGFEIPLQQQSLRPGAYDVLLSNCPAFHVERVTSPSVKTEGRSFEFGGADSVRLIVEIGAGLGHVDGVVLREGKPASGVMVLMVPADGPVAASLILRNQSNTDGSFFWNSIRPGRYTIVALDNGWNLEWAKPEVLKPLLLGGETIQVAPNGQHKVTVNVQ